MSSAWTNYDRLFLRSFEGAIGWAEAVVQKSLPTGFVDGEVLQGEVAYDYLVSARESMVAAAAELASEYDSAVWLRLVRTLDSFAFTHLIEGGLPGDKVSVFLVAENIVGSAEGHSGIQFSESSLDEATSVRLARLIALASKIDDSERAIRSVTKGVEVRVRSEGLPTPAGTDYLEDAIGKFDLLNSFQSADRWQDELSPAATYTMPGNPPMLVAHRFRNGIAVPEVSDGPLRDGQLPNARAQFSLRRFSTGDPTSAVFTKETMSYFDDPEATVSLVVFGHALLRYVLDRDDQTRRAVARYGTIESRTEVLENELDVALSDSEVSKWLSLHGFDRLTPSRVLHLVSEIFEFGKRSYPGKIVHFSGPNALVDVDALGWHASVELRVLSSGGGAHVQSSATKFEETTQAVIDASPFAPPSRLRALRGKDLKLEGRVITDLDALFVVGASLYLVSCKRVLLRDQHLAGDFKSVRNAESRVNDALDEWAEKVQRIRDAPIGNNYDFDGFHIEGIVLTPQLIFSTRPDAYQIIELGIGPLFLTRLTALDNLIEVLNQAPGYVG